MNCNFEEFVGDALRRGTGMRRQIPIFIPDGKHQDDLYEKAMKYLKKHRFHIMDLRNKSYEEAAESLNLKWPNFSVRDRSAGYRYDVKESESRLLILWGEESNSSFWKYLVEQNVLYAGNAFPPVRKVLPRCIVIPDGACIAVMVKGKDLDNFPLHYFDVACRFYSNAEENRRLKEKVILKRQFTDLCSIFFSFHDNSYKCDEAFSLRALTPRQKEMIDERVSDYLEEREAQILFRTFRIMINPVVKHLRLPLQTEPLYSFCFLLEFIRYMDNTETLKEIEKLGSAHSFSLHEINKRLYRIHLG